MKQIAKLALMALLAVTAGPSQGQTPEAKADLALLETRAAGDPLMGQVWVQLRSETSARSGQSVLRIVETLSGIRQTRDGALPLSYRLQGQVQAAAIRAQTVAEILRSDLNGDWQVSREELVASLSHANRGGGGEAATAFLLGDADQNSLLTTEEIKASAEAMLPVLSGRRGMDVGARLFDLDDDGILTQSEYDRVVAALQR